MVYTFYAFCRFTIPFMLRVFFRLPVVSNIIKFYMNLFSGHFHAQMGKSKMEISFGSLNFYGNFPCMFAVTRSVLQKF